MEMITLTAYLLSYRSWNLFFQKIAIQHTAAK